MQDNTLSEAMKKNIQINLSKWLEQNAHSEKPCKESLHC